MPPLSSTQLCEGPGVTVYPAANTAYNCSGNTLSLHAGLLRIILQDTERTITTPETVITAENAYLDLEVSEEGLTKMSLRDGKLTAVPKNTFLPEVQMEGGQYSEIGRGTITSPVTLGHQVAPRDIVAASLFSPQTITPLVALLTALLGISGFVYLMAYRNKPHTNKGIQSETMKESEPRDRN